MNADILTVIWKERKSLLMPGGSRGRAALMLLPLLMVAIGLPLQMKGEWLTHAWALIVALVVPLITVGVTIPDAFAGERERHTLATLLASRLPDRAILFGKWGLAVAYGWGVCLLALILGLILVNLLEWQGRVRLYALPVALGGVIGGLLIAALIASVGVVISLRAATAQGAAQALTGVFLAPIVILQLAPVLFLSVIPDGRAILTRLLSADLTQVVLVFLAVLLVLNVAALAVALYRFQRAKLILA